MAFKKDGNLSYEVNPDGINEVIDEKGSMTLMLREVAWNGRQSHLELRKWVVDVDKEQPMRGVSFITEDGPHNLAEVLVQHKYGNTKNLLKQLSARDDFEEALIDVIGKKKVVAAKNTTAVVTEDDYYDPKTLIA